MQKAKRSASPDLDPRKKTTYDAGLMETLRRIPSASFYEKSFSHPGTVTKIVATEAGFVITGDSTGVLKFWKETKDGLEFIRRFKAHQSPIQNLELSHDGTYLASSSTDPTVHIFDVVAFDMVQSVTLDFEPQAMVWVQLPKSIDPGLLVSKPLEAEIVLVQALEEGQVQATLHLHTGTVTHMAYNPAMNAVISCSVTGAIEVWQVGAWHGRVDEVDLPSQVSFDMKIDTDLYFYIKRKIKIHSLSVSPTGTHFAVLSSDFVCRVFQFQDCRIVFQTNVEPSSYQVKCLDEASPFLLEESELKRRLVVEEEIGSCERGITFDQSGKLLLIASLAGIEMYRLGSSELLGILSKEERIRHLVLCLTHQGLLLTAPFKSKMICQFSHREPADRGKRDEYNEPLQMDKEEKQHVAKSVGTEAAFSSATIHTTKGDIKVDLFGSKCPTTVHNWIVHAQHGYYDGLLFHRVIKNFMIQTGDPKGDGTGGESIWGKPFKDEFHPSLSHDKAGVLSMANAGPNTNGSQFFITTIPCPWLDEKHTIFGQVLHGLETVHRIERVETDSTFNKPVDDVKIVSISLHK